MMETGLDIVTLGFALAFAAIHVNIGKLGIVARPPRSGWLSFAGGTAVAYVFLHVLPDLGAHRQSFAAALGIASERAEIWVYALALVGLALFYGLDNAVRASRKANIAKGGPACMGDDILWVHIGSFATLNLMIGYLLVRREEAGATELALYFAAMALHFVTADFGMRRDHEEAYDRLGRWVIAGAVMLGWALGVLIDVPEIAIGGLFAFVAGGVILNVMKEELPEDRESRFIPFLAGAAIYAALVVGEAQLG